MNKENKYFTPSIAKRRENIATIGERSIIPNGGMICLNGAKNGSTNLLIVCPNLDSLAFGTQDIKMYIIHTNQ